MADAHSTRQVWLAKVATQAPWLFDFLTDHMGLQRKLDPNAGYKAAQLPTMVAQYDFSFIELEIILQKLCKDDPIKFYILFRALNHNVLKFEDVKALLPRGRPPAFRWLLKEICKRDPSFNKEALKG